MRTLVTATLAVALLGAAAGTAEAHAFDPNVLQLHEQADGAVRVTWTTSTPDATSMPRLPDRCVRAPGLRPTPTVSKPRRSLQWRADCGPSGIGGARITIDGPSADADTIVRLHRQDGTRWTTLAKAGGDAIALPEGPSMDRWAVVGRYLTLGVEHIVLGIDHLLFLVALWLLVPDRRGLFRTITAFTVGHSVTLALATLDVVTPRAAPVEVVIALSILVLARQTAVERTPDRAHPLRRRTWTVALGFGLLHGFGFAGALRSLGVPQAQIVEALGAFNLGVELGQLAFVALLAGGVHLTRRPFRSLHPAGRRLVAYGLGATATFWTLERAIQLGA